MYSVLMNVPDNLTALEKAVYMALRELHPAMPCAYDGETLKCVRKMRFLLHTPAGALVRNLIGPSHGDLLNALDSLKTKGYLLDHQLESQEEAEDHGMINWINPAPRKRVFQLAA